MSKFKSGKILLQPQDVIGYTFQFPTCSSATANDGAIPFGRTISSVTVVAYNEDDEIITNDLLDELPTLSDDLVTVVLKYAGVGRYKLTFKLTLDNSWIKEVDFTTIYGKDL